MSKAIKITDPYTKPKLHWLVLPGLRKLMPMPWKYHLPDLKIFEQFKK